MQRFLLVVIAAFAVLALAHGETTCQSHKRNSQTSGHGMKWNIQCDSDGYYLPLQCTEDEKPKNRWCACYNKEEAITTPSRKTRTCVCPLAGDEASNNDARPCDIPTCDTMNTGKFAKKQCCTSTGKCKCVDENTGETRTQPTNDPNLQCS